MAANRKWQHTDAVKRGRKELAMRKKVMEEARAETQRRGVIGVGVGDRPVSRRVALWEVVWPFVLFGLVFGTALFGLVWLFLRGGL